ncbi:MAG TPA: hypothetical protein VF139_15515 [Candidatus Polarisedimenticolaceae bacterium]
MAGEPKDFWDKLAVLLHPLGGLLTAISVAYVGLIGSQVLDRRQAAETNARLYSELMSRREEAESSLRKDMFVSIIQSFLRPGAEDVDSKLLNLELLAYNFHDSLNLEPLFLDIQRRLLGSSDRKAEEQIARMRRVARDITARQLFSLEGKGQSFRRTVDLEELARVGRTGVELEGETMSVGGSRFGVALRVLDSDPKLQQVRVRLEVQAQDGTEAGLETRATFDVGWFDFPVIDNTRLANGARCAVSLSAFAPDAAADLTTICFPGEYASLKDRPYYDEVIEKLRESAETAAEPAPPVRGGGG